MVRRTINFIDIDGLHEHYKLRTLRKIYLICCFYSKNIVAVWNRINNNTKTSDIFMFTCCHADSTSNCIYRRVGTSTSLHNNHISISIVVAAVADVAGSRLSAKLWICASLDSHLASYFSGQHSYRFRPVSDPRHNILLPSVPAVKRQATNSKQTRTASFRLLRLAS